MTLARTRHSGAFLSLRDGTFRLGDRLVFSKTTWTFRRDEHWAVIGENGSGKSLFGDCVRGCLPLVQGELQYHFKSLAGLTPEETIGHLAFEDRKIEVHGTVVQSRWNSLEETDALRVGDFLSYERVMEVNPFEVTERHEPERQFARRRRRAVALLGLEHLLGRALLSLSNGERQRVELARALCRPLRLLILDEPFAGLDTVTRAQLHKILARLMATPLRVLLISTRVEDLPAAITHVLRVEACRVRNLGTRRTMLGNRIPRRQSAANPRLAWSSTGARACAGQRWSPRRLQSAASELFRLNRVNVRYGGTTILREVSWSVRAGESWALLGANGSGKSTLLSLLLGDNPQVYANDITVFGRRRGDGESVWALKKRIGWVSSELHVHFDDNMTCFEAVGSGFHNSIGIFERLNWRQRAAARHWLREFGLEAVAGRPMFELSAGTQRMALLARALVKRPRLLVLDEPCQGLDTEHARRFVALVDKLIRTSAVTVLYVTHREEEIPQGIYRVLRLRKGRTLVSEL